VRLPLLPASDIRDDRRQLYDAFVANVYDNFPDIVTMREDGALLGPWGVWIQLPEVGKPMLHLIEAIRSIPGLSQAGRQVVILMVGGRYRAAYEIYAHAAAARHAGLSDRQIAALLAGERPGDLDAEQNAAADVTAALLDGAVLPRPVYDRALEQLGQEGLNAVVFTAAQYSFVAVMLNAYNVPSPQES
jgi:4-carboxymuconolactone decarboxylase